MSLNTFTSGINTSFSTELNENFATLDYKPLKSATLITTTITNTTDFTSFITTSIDSSSECTYFILKPRFTFGGSNSTPGGAYRLVVTFSDLTSSIVVPSTYVTITSSSAKTGYKLLTNYTAPINKYITGIDFQVKSFDGSYIGTYTTYASTGSRTNMDSTDYDMWFISELYYNGYD